MKKLLIITLILLASFIYVSDKKVVADSGFDSGSSDSWSDSSDSWSDSSESASTSDDALIYFIVIFGLLFILGIMVSTKKMLNSKIYLLIVFILISVFAILALSIFAIPFLIVMFIAYIKSKDKIKNIISEDVSEEILKEFNIEDIEKLKWDLYNNFVEIQRSWMNFNYNNLKSLTTDELYNQYKSQLEVLELKGDKNVMERFEYVDSKIVSIEKIGNKENLKLMLNVKMYDYILNKEGKVIQGDKNRRIDITYIIHFERNITSNITICPNCGGQVLDNTCLNCNSKVLYGSNEYVMSKKENIAQVWEN